MQEEVIIETCFHSMTNFTNEFTSYGWSKDE